MEDDLKDKLLKIINHYGVMKQLKYIHSEYYELDEAIVEYETLYNNDCNMNQLISCKKHIEEEIADVFVLLHQIRFYYDLDDEEVQRIFNEKIDRQLKRIEQEKKNKEEEIRKFYNQEIDRLNKINENNEKIIKNQVNKINELNDKVDTLENKIIWQEEHI